MCKHSKHTNESMLSNWDEGFMKIQETVADHLPQLASNRDRCRHACNI
jgi:hypothetical protein